MNQKEQVECKPGSEHREAPTAVETTEKSSASGQEPENSGKNKEEGKENMCCYCGTIEAFWSSIPCRPDHSHSKEEVEEQQKEKPEEETRPPENVESKEETPGTSEERTEKAVPEVRTEEGVPEERTQEAIPELRAEEEVPEARTGAEVPEERTGAENPEERVAVSVPEESKPKPEAKAKSKGPKKVAEQCQLGENTNMSSVSAGRLIILREKKMKRHAVASYAS